MDISGVVLRAANEEDFKIVLTKFAHALGVDPDIVVAIRKEHVYASLLGNFTNRDFFAEIEKRAKKQLPADAEDLWLRTGLPEVEINRPLLTWIDTVRNKYEVAVFSDISSLRHSFDLALGMYEHFDRTILSLEAGMTKDNPAFFTYALGELDVLPSETLLIDDQERNIAMAASLGIHAVQYKKEYFDTPGLFIHMVEPFVSVS